ncbi:hypothetical protein QE385_000985 [Sphingomonas sp. SORGH_AS 950]|uniref:DUF6975 family protein n=2 Tax=unclassified Sphingomonas TaxID=196159 RepID=UPI0027853E1A|nr:MULTISPECIES: hypothetical protein [unclassified Sphingomonas]MDQ1156658.1 hypothetical protein [Sphingomonas sp. SORGH_AS_0950]MDR6115485.1 hypothetical protein [Sphingomonas sp. SORGH_AS_0789]MDR6147050.1 hypothetical protein [Sphingomonas sp. SORGH_AS_0870]MDR6150844.1 hypothetical protein [Sphingomonas sp. SORGH_AS_0742]
MASSTAFDIQNDRSGDIGAIMARLGSAGHPHVQALLLPQALLHDLTDAVHAVCAVHGNHPCMIDYAMARGIQIDTLPWLIQSSTAFAHERAYLAHLTSAAGPLPSTPGQAQTDAALTQLRHTLEMLANSDRRGCATGAVSALILDWRAIRQVLDQAARRFGLASLPGTMPDPILDDPEDDTAIGLARARGFGATQLFVQHRGLWNILEARASARRG